MLLKPFYGRLFFTPDGDGGAGGSGGDSGSGGEQQGDGDQGGGDGDAGASGADRLKALEDERDKARTESKWVDKLLKDAQRELAALKNAGKSEEETREAALKALETRAETAERQARDANGRSAVTTAASKANAIDAAVIFPLIRDQLDFNDDGEPTNVEEAIAAAKKRHPALFRASSGSGDGGKRGDGNDAALDINQALRRTAGRT